MAYSLGVVRKEIENLSLEIDSENFSVNEVWVKIRMILNRLKKTIYYSESFLSSTNLASRKSSARIQIHKSRALDTPFSKKRYTISINGKMLEMLKANENLLDHFVFIAYFCKGIVGYDISPNDKDFLAYVVKKKFAKCPVILAIGNGYNDISMMKKSDVSIELIDFTSSSPIKKFVGGDIISNNFNSIREIIREKAFIFNEKLLKIIFFCYFISTICANCWFLYTIFFGLLTKSFLKIYLYIIKDILIIPAIGIIFFFWGETSSKKLLKMFVWIYKDGKSQNDLIFQQIFTKVLLKSFIYSLLFLCVLVFGVVNLENGNIFGIDQLEAFFWSCTFILAFQYFVLSFQSPFLISIIFVIVGSFIYLVVALIDKQINKEILNCNFYETFILFFQNIQTYFLFTFMILLNFGASVCDKAIFDKFFRTNYSKIKDLLKRNENCFQIQKMNFINNRNNRDFTIKNISNLVRCLFKNTEIDNSIQESNLFFF